eukprot:5027145-Prymnesium_polylepis.1
MVPMLPARRSRYARFLGVVVVALTCLMSASTAGVMVSVPRSLLGCRLTVYGPLLVHVCAATAVAI